MGLWVLLTYPVFWLGLGKNYPFSLLGTHGPAIGVAFWSVITLAWIAGAFLACRSAGFENLRIRALAAERVWVISGAVFVLALDGVQWLSFKKFGYQLPWSLFVIDLALLVYASVRRGTLGIRDAWIFAIAHQGLSILHFPLSELRSDMLPLIQMAAANFLGGLPAYAARFSGAPYGIPYPPLSFLAYLPSAVIKVDPRWMNCLWILALGLVCESRERKGASVYRGLVVLWFLNPYLQFRHELYLHFFWFVSALAILSAQSGRWLKTATLAGIASATMIWAWICVPFWLLLSTAQTRDPRRLLIGSAWALSIVAGVGACFYLREGTVFWEGVTAHFKHASQAESYFELCLGLSPGLAALGLGYVLFKVQVFFLLAVGTWALWVWWESAESSEGRDETKRRKLALLFAIGLFGFNFLSSLLENYHYLLPLLMMALLEAPASSEDEVAA